MTDGSFCIQLEFSLLLSTIATTLLNFGDTLSLSSAWAFTVLAILSLCYSMGLFLWRVDKIRKRRAVNYHDKWGPSVLCVGLVVAVGVGFGVRFGQGGGPGLKG